MEHQYERSWEGLKQRFAESFWHNPVEVIVGSVLISALVTAMLAGAWEIIT